MNNDELLHDIEHKFNTLLNARSLAISSDKNLLEFLLIHSKFKDEYRIMFFKIYEFDKKDAMIFKQDDFLTFLDIRLLGNSYTMYSNKIGLGNQTNKFIKTNKQVVLNFPFKDGIIKGCQTKDSDKTNEIFFNNILDKNEIDILFTKKALYNFEYISKNSININETLYNNLNNKNNQYGTTNTKSLSINSGSILLESPMPPSPRL